MTIFPVPTLRLCGFKWNNFIWFVHPKLPLAARLGHCWGARPSRWPFSASRQKPFSAGARIVPIRSAPPDQPALKSFQPSLVMPPAASWDNSRSAGNPQRRQARHICRNRNHQILKLRRSGIVLADGHHDVAPTELDSFAWLVLQRFQSYGLRRLRTLRDDKNSNALCPVRPPQTALVRPAGTLLGSAPVPVAVFGVAPKTVFWCSGRHPACRRAVASSPAEKTVGYPHVPEHFATR